MFHLTPDQAKAAKAFNQKHFDDSEINYASGEVLCNTAYDLSRLDAQTIESKVFSIMQPNGGWEDYTAKAFKTTGYGLNGFVLLPTGKQSKDVKVIFSGTTCLMSLLRDLELEGPGATEMDFEKDSLMDQLDDMLVKHYGKRVKNIHLSVAGHSLGASDAENFSANLIQNIAKDVHKSKFNHLSVYSYNSPGISHQRSSQSGFDALRIKKENPNFKIDAHFGKSTHDIIQQLGESHVFKGNTLDEVNIDLLKITKASLVEHNKKRKMMWGERDAQDVYDNVLEAGLSLLFHLYSMLLKVIQSHRLSTFFTPMADGMMTRSHKTVKKLVNQNQFRTMQINKELQVKANRFIGTYKKIFGFLNDVFEGFLKDCMDGVSSPVDLVSPSNEKSFLNAFDNHKKASNNKMVEHSRSCRAECVQEDQEDSWRLRLNTLMSVM